MNPNEPTRFFKGYSVWMLRFKDIPEVLRLYEKNQKLQLGYIDGTRRLNALEKYERLESKSDGYCQKSFYRQQPDDRKTKKLTKHTKQCIQITQLYKTRKTGSASPKGSGAAGKARNLKKRAFSLPYISYNLHYTKYYKNQKQRPPSPAFRHRCRFWEPLLFFYIISFGTCGSPAKQAS